MPDPVFAWHVHHGVLLEPLTEPIEVRQDYIRDAKPASEVALRLRLLKPVQGKLPSSLIKAQAAYDKAWAAYDKARAAHSKAAAAYAGAEVVYKSKIEALHAQECPDCPWDGQTIFPENGEADA